jgi:HK97 family phage portal protein
MGVFSLFRKKSVTSRQLSELIALTAQASSGVSVTPQVAMRCAPFYSAVKDLSESIAKLPFILYRDPELRERAVDHPLYDVLKNRPNALQTPLEFRRVMQLNAFLHGQSFAFINRGVGGVIKELFPLNPGRVKWELSDSWAINYEIRDKGGNFKPVPTDRIFRLSVFPSDITGAYDGQPLDLLKNLIGLTVATEKYGAKFFANATRPGGLIKLLGKVSPAEKDLLKDKIEQGFSGDNAHRLAVFAGDLDFVELGRNAEEAQFVETRKYQRSETAGGLGVPPHVIGDYEKATYSNIEHQAIDYVVRSILCLAVGWEQAVSMFLLTESERKEYFAEILLDALLRGDTLSRYQAYQIAFMNGFMNADEIRAKENMRKRADGFGGQYYYPGNLMPAGTKPKVSGPEDKKNEDVATTATL